MSAPALPYARPERRPATLRRVVVVGAGSIGQRHLRNLAELGIEAAALRTYRGTTGPLVGVPSLTTWDAVDVFAPDAIIIANPTALHSEVAVRAASAGYHLLVEKPLAHDVAAAVAACRAAAHAGVVALVGYHFRHHPSLQVMRDWIRQGAIGTPVHAQVTWGEYLPGWHPGEDHLTGYSARRALGGGAVLTLSHPIDYLRWLLGEVTEVSAMVSQSTPYTLDVEDVAHLTLRFASGVLAAVTLDYAQRPAEHTLRIVGLDGTLTWDARTGVARRTGPDGEVLEAGVAPGFQRNDLFRAELRHFAECVAGEATPACTMDDGLAAVRICVAAMRSSAWGRVVDA
ncbi:MAG: Gfo/Idh/MocA family oxidoreductase [Gemmatimonadetes bacterium]|nr:Gfo/Idh/MocA family oxidoreductase [Gemmatimonadota bacterium]